MKSSSSYAWLLFLSLSSAVLGLVLLLVSQPTSVEAKPLGITRPYPGGAPCNTSLQACIDGSANGDSINIAAGFYITSVTLSKAVSLNGAGAASTFIQALSNQRVMTVTSSMTSSTQIANMTIQGGNAGTSNGGGIYLLVGAQPLIQNVEVTANFAANGGGIFATSPITIASVNINGNAATIGSGGGLYASSDAAATNSVIQSNTVITNGYGGGIFVSGNFTGTGTNFIGNTVNNGFDGGGLYVGGSLSLTGGQFSYNQSTKQKGYGGGGGLISFGATTISGTQFISNTAADWGGGAYIAYFGNTTPTSITNAQFISNTAIGGGGGGLFMWFDSNLASVDFFTNTAGYRGGGAYVGYAGNSHVTLNNGQFISNTSPAGGGLYSDSSFVLTGTQFLRNTALNGNGGGAWTPLTGTVTSASFYSNTVITNGNGGGLNTDGNLIAHNTLFQNNRTLTGNGGGSRTGGNATLTNMQYIGNSSNVNGGAIAALLSVTTTNSTFTNNGATNGSGGAIWSNGGINVNQSTFTGNTTTNLDGGAVFAILPSTIVNGLFQNNSSGRNGGGIFISNTLTISTSHFLSNVTNASGGGIYQAAGDGRIVNSLLANNLSLSNVGAALYLSPTGTEQILFTTIGATSLFGGDAVRINSGSVTFEDDIVTNHAVGLGRFGGTVFEDYNLFYGNSVNKSGAMTGGTHDVFGNPLFVNPSSYNYHLMPSSAAIDAGTDAGVYIDVDGQTRPFGAGFDIGYDELRLFLLNLPLILK